MTLALIAALPFFGALLAALMIRSGRSAAEWNVNGRHASIRSSRQSVSTCRPAIRT